MSVVRLRTLKVGCFGGGTGLPSLLGGAVGGDNLIFLVQDQQGVGYAVEDLAEQQHAQIGACR